MKPVDQTVHKFPNGNCMQACVASVFELPLEDVPNFMRDGPDSFNRILNNWLSRRGLVSLDARFEDEVTQDCYMIACGDSLRGDVKHAVVYYNGKMVHDPHPDREGVKDEGLTYTLFVVKNPAELGGDK
jgi:hypothetical protein